MPAQSVHKFVNLEKLGYPKIKNVKTNQRYKICLIDLMLLKRQKLEAITLTGQLKADGAEVDMGGLGRRPTFAFGRQVRHPEILKKILIQFLKQKLYKYKLLVITIGYLPRHTTRED